MAHGKNGPDEPDEVILCCDLDQPRGQALIGPWRLTPRALKRMTRVGFEPTPGYPDEKPAIAGKLSLESHALDRSAILP